MNFDIGTISKKIKLRQFEEYPACALCGSENRENVLVADGNPIVRSIECNLHDTCPRPKLDEWEWFLANSDTPRNKRVTDNRINLGVSNETNAAMMPANWRQ